MSRTYCRYASAEVMEIDGETLILNQESFAVTKLNESGGQVWKMLGENLTIAQLSERLSVEYADADPDRVRSDLASFLDQLKEIGLVQGGE